MFVARQSSHIQSDIARNWSSWNFGEEGFKGTREQLDNYLESATEEMPCFISGMEIYPDQVDSFEFGELYENYWVVIDNVNSPGGLSCLNLKAESLEEAISEALSLQGEYCGDGSSFDATNAKLVYSNEEIHVFEIVD